MITAMTKILLVPALLLVVVLGAPALMRTRVGRRRGSRLHTIVSQVRGALARL